MKCPKCQSDRMNYSMTRDRKGIMHSYAECQNCHARWEREMVTQSNPQTSTETQYEDKTSSEHGDTALRIATIIFVLFIIAVNILSFSFLPKAGLGLLVILIFIKQAKNLPVTTLQKVPGRNFSAVFNPPAKRQ